MTQASDSKVPVSNVNFTTQQVTGYETHADFEEASIFLIMQALENLFLSGVIAEEAHEVAMLQCITVSKLVHRHQRCECAAKECSHDTTT